MGLLNLIALICIAAAVVTAAPTSTIESPFIVAPTNTTIIAAAPIAKIELKKDISMPIVAIGGAESRNLTAIVDGTNGTKIGEMKLDDKAAAVDTQPSVHARNVANTTTNTNTNIYNPTETLTAAVENDPANKYLSGLTEYGYCQRIRREMPHRRSYSGARKAFHFKGHQQNSQQFTPYRDLDVDREVGLDDSAVQELVAGHPALEDLLNLYKTYKYNHENDFKMPTTFFEEEDELPMRSTFEFFV